ncbi:hypothetical protein MXB_1895 [Myxobolus squamalis]|nr:hypothetical protein MXB_1895 [Myxobolus squamalis]
MNCNENNNLIKKEDESIKKVLISLNESKKFLERLSSEVKRQGYALDRTEHNVTVLHYTSKETERIIDEINITWKRFIHMLKEAPKPPEYQNIRNLHDVSDTTNIEIQSNNILDELNINLIDFKSCGLALLEELTIQNQVIDRIRDAIIESNAKIKQVDIYQKKTR